MRWTAATGLVLLLPMQLYSAGFLGNGALLRSLLSFGFAFTAEWAFTVAIGLVAGGGRGDKPFMKAGKKHHGEEKVGRGAKHEPALKRLAAAHGREGQGRGAEPEELRGVHPVQDDRRPL